MTDIHCSNLRKGNLNISNAIHISKHNLNTSSIKPRPRKNSMGLIRRKNTVRFILTYFSSLFNALVLLNKQNYHLMPQSS